MGTLTEAPAGWTQAGQCGLRRPKLLKDWREAGRFVEGPDFVWVSSAPGSGPAVRAFYNPTAVAREVNASEQAKHAGLVQFGSHLRPRPPGGGIKIVAAARKYGLSRDTIAKLITDGKVAAGLSDKAGPNGRRFVLVSSPGLARLTAVGRKPMAEKTGSSPPADGTPIEDLARENRVPTQTLWKWKSWPTHPLLGRAVRAGVGIHVEELANHRQRRRRVLLLSRSDVLTCADLIRNPLNRPIPGNPGVWIAEGIFRHTDGRLFFTTKYVHLNRGKFEFRTRQVFSPSFRKRLESLPVVWPQAGRAKEGRWTLTVYSEATLDQVAKWRSGRSADGEWLAPGVLWKDAEGLWYSTSTIRQQLGLSKCQFESLVVERGLQSWSKKVTPRAMSGPNAGKLAGLTRVFHDSKVLPLLGIGGPAARSPAEASPVASAGEKPKGGRPRSPKTAEVYAFCYAQWVTGKKLASIRLAAVQKFGMGRAPKEDSHVTTFANIHVDREKAKGHTLPVRAK
jgi:hypothetical protein